MHNCLSHKHLSNTVNIGKHLKYDMNKIHASLCQKEYPQREPNSCFLGHNERHFKRRGGGENKKDIIVKYKMDKFINTATIYLC